MLLLRPQLVAADIKGRKAAVDAARWAVLSSSKERGLESLDVVKMPRGCTATLIYLEGDQEDDALKTALEDDDVAVEVRYVDSLEELDAGIVSAVSDMLAGDGAATEESSDEEV